MMTQPAEQAEQGDVEGLRARRIGHALLGHRDRGAVHDRFRKGIQHRGGGRALVGEVERHAGRHAFQRTGVFAGDAHHTVAAARGGTREGGTHETRGTGDKNGHGSNSGDKCQRTTQRRPAPSSAMTAPLRT